MSKYKHWYRYIVVTMLRAYPALKAEKAARQSGAMTANYSGMPRSGVARRTTEDVAARGLSSQEDAIIDAVDKAIETMRYHRDGAEVLKIIKMVDFDRRYTVEGAAVELHMSRGTAIARRSRFIDLVGKYMGY